MSVEFEQVDSFGSDQNCLSANEFSSICLQLCKLLSQNNKWLITEPNSYIQQRSTTMNHSPSIQIKASEIVQLILQFLQENNFNKTFQTFQEESKISLNIINHKQLISAFHDKSWTAILKQLSQLMMPEDLFFTSYEFVIDGLLEGDHYQASSYLIDSVLKPNIKDYQSYRQRIMRMQYIITHPNEKNLYKKPITRQRQESLTNQLINLSSEAQPSRLLTLLGQSLKYQTSQSIINPSISLNLFTNKQLTQQTSVMQTEAIIKQIQKTLSYSEQSKITSIQLSWSEEYLAIGGIDGLIELYNTRTYELYDNKYQNQGQMFFHDHPVTQMEFNYTDDILATVDSNGLVNMWNLENGNLLRKIDKEERVNAICWGAQASHILLGYKEKIKLYGIRSCNVLKQFVMNNSSEYISHLYVTETRLFVITSAGTVTIFSYSTQEQLFNLQMKSPLISCVRIFKNNVTTSTHLFDRLLIGFQKFVIQIDQNGTQVKNYPVIDGQLENSISKGQYIYMCIKGHDKKYRLSVAERTVSNKGNFNKGNGSKVVFYMALEAGIQQMLISRRRNLLVTYDQQHKLSFWRSI